MKTSKTTLYIVSFIVLFMVLSACGRSVTLYCKVIDDDGLPVSRADVVTGYSTGQESGIGPDEHEKRGTTDTDGIYLYRERVSHDDEVRDILMSVKKDGYYPSFPPSITAADIVEGRWGRTTDPMTVILRKIINPVPMYARKAELQIPLVGKEIGFDLVLYDWISPYGNGENSDIIFKIEQKYAADRDFESTLTVIFPRILDGIQPVKEKREYGSLLKLPRTAPDTGYIRKLVFKKDWLPGRILKQDYDKDTNYIFRVRSEEREGKLFRAMYGKIKDDIRFWPKSSDTAIILFTYYLNPDYTKNLEYDGAKNLFRDLRDRRLLDYVEP